ncbi:MAG: S41 family peptidase [Tunicatimonas sp.]|uniref:S41 family peptidase n=1 Tax=Tunicatimonas sp. TaxID=1940096 RepID=UPI003C724ED4
MSKTSNSKFQIRLPILLTIAVAAGILIGATMADGDGAKSDIISGYLKFKEILTYVQRDYVDKVDTDDLVETAISRMLEKLDPHSVYIPAKELELAKSQLEGEFEGIGIEFNIIKDTIYVVAPLSGGPSEEVGLQSGDKIVKVDGEIVAGTGIDNRDVFDLLRGKKGTEVKVEIKRKGAKGLMDFTIIRDKIPQESVDASYMVDSEVGYIKVSRFQATTYDEFREALSELKSDGMKKLILDLQDNPGGYMDKAINMADEFLRDDAMIVYTEGKQPRYNSQARAYREGLFESQPIIVLINEGSASASEIVAGALQDNDRALIVGRRSFGKGLVQMPIPLDDGSELRLTISRYYTPSGRSIQKPYEEGAAEYSQDVRYRYEHGELFSADSIHFDDSLKYETINKGRLVYGGGGIMPDFFVPLDTSNIGNSSLGKLYNTNAIREYTLLYYENNKKELESMKLQDYISNFEVTDEMVDEIVNITRKNGEEVDKEEVEKAKDLIKNRVKGQIARGVWGNDGAFSIFNERNQVLQKALKLFGEAERLASR